MKKNFQKKNVWIIGASSGIGEALAFYLNKIGAKIIISSRRVYELERVKNSSAHPQNIEILPLDLLNFSSFKEKTQMAFSVFKRIDYVFLNGGTSSRGFVSETVFEVHKYLMDLNYFSYVNLTKEILPFFEQQGTGHFIVTSSVMGKIGTPNRSAYAASKHALHGFFDCLRAEVYKENIKITLLTPGHISTNISLNTITANGTPNGKTNTLHDNGLAAEKAAEKILKAVKRNKNEVYIGKINIEYFSLLLFRFFPGLFHKIVRKVKT